MIDTCYKCGGFYFKEPHELYESFGGMACQCGQPTPKPQPLVSHPRRVQLSRKKGWRLPANTVVVSRPSKWGNPYKVVAGDRQSAVNCYRMELEWILSGATTRDYLALAKELAKLRGKNLACWCPLDEPCHADVLLRLANGTR